MPKKNIQGIVISDKMEKTVVVTVEKMEVHPIYKKRSRKNIKYKAHNELGAKAGDTVIIEESRPLSREKRWLVTEILNHKNLKSTEEKTK